MLLASTGVNCDQDWPSQTEKSLQAPCRCRNKGRSLNAAWITEPPPDISFWHCFCAHSFKQIRANRPHSRRLEKKKGLLLLALAQVSSSQRAYCSLLPCPHFLCVWLWKHPQCSWACNQLNSNIRSSIRFSFHLQTGQWLAFTDPATSHHPGSISASKDRSRWVRVSCPSVPPVSASQADSLDFTGSVTSFSIRQWGRGVGAKTDAHQFRIHVAQQGTCAHGWLSWPGHSSAVWVSKVILSSGLHILCTTQSAETRYSSTGLGVSESHDMSHYAANCKSLEPNICKDTQQRHGQLWWGLWGWVMTPRLSLKTLHRPSHSLWNPGRKCLVSASFETWCLFVQSQSCYIAINSFQS